MEEIHANLRKHFPSLTENALTKIYRMRVKIMRLLMIHGILVDVRWMIEARVRLSGESVDSYIPSISSLGKSTYARKRRAK